MLCTCQIRSVPVFLRDEDRTQNPLLTGEMLMHCCTHTAIDQWRNSSPGPWKGRHPHRMHCDRGHSQTNSPAHLPAGTDSLAHIHPSHFGRFLLGDSSSVSKSVPAAPAFEAKKTAPSLKPRFFKLRA